MSLTQRVRARLALALGVVIAIPAFALGLASPANAAYGDTYIGYTKDDGWDATRGTAFDNIYVYEGTTAPIPDSNSVVANLVYCFTLHRIHPDTTLDDPNASDFETYVRQIGSGNLLQYTDRAASPVYTPLGFDAHVESVLYNGYPNDNAGIQAHYGLTDAEFHAMTQSAIWALTDARGVSLANDPNGGDMRYDIATARVDPNLFTTDAQKQAYYALLGIAAPADGTDMTGAPTLAQVPAEVRLDIYESTDSSYQNLLSASFVPTNPTPTPTPTDEPTPTDKPTPTDQPTTPADTTPAPGSQQPGPQQPGPQQPGPQQPGPQQPGPQQPGLVGTGVDGAGALGVLIAAVLVAGMGVLLMTRGRRTE
ncbi:thioester-forming surface-anchored protein [Pseudoclavibacter alba]|uniref:Thioester-forming surface-anchored protein n=1 Tax=Pseudoclavibacter albus TaxID=272241 RepID=A0ABT2HX45_9MICO|nr:thioester-forming surface-anchored protein [Pseudoclavibacter alba]MCT2042888.1 thioester-forming surface-anchored protein [Pseudoclavibacter alba]